MNPSLQKQQPIQQPIQSTLESAGMLEFIEYAATPIFTKNLYGIITTWNQKAEQMYGYRKEEIIGKSALLLVPNNKKDEVNEILYKIRHNEKIEDFETINLTKDGRFLNIKSSISPLKKEGEIIGAIVTQYDISSLRETEAYLVETQTRSDALLESIGDGVVALDEKLNITLMNKAALTMLGWKLEEVIGKEVSTVMPLLDEKGNLFPNDKRPSVLAITTGVTTTSTTAGIGTFYLRKDGTKFPAEIKVAPVRVADKIVGVIDVFRDITKEKEIDKEKNEFVSITAHQLRGPLGISKWYFEAMQNDPYIKSAPKTISDYIQVMYASNERVLALIRELLSVSRIEQRSVKNTPESINLIENVTGIVKELQLIAQKKSINLSLEIKTSSLSKISIDSLRFHEAVQNLISNAIDYTPALGKVVVTIDSNDKNITIAITDTGIGIALEDQKKLFTKYFRADKAIEFKQEGSGLGLYVVKSYVEGWGGTITFISTEGKGSTFTITLPVTPIMKH